MNQQNLTIEEMGDQPLSEVENVPIVTNGKTHLISFSDVSKLAQTVFKSNLFPALKNQNQAFTLMMICQSEGIHPIQAMRRYDIIEGKPGLKSSAMLSDFKKMGGKYRIIENTDKVCKIHFEHQGIEADVTWTIEMTTHLVDRYGKVKANWKNYPRQMLFARCCAEGVRMVAPEVNQGIYTSEEIMDFDDLTPNKNQSSSPAPETGLDPEKEIKPDDAGTKKRNKKIRNALNPKLLKAKTMEALEKVVTEWMKDYSELLTANTYQKKLETFASLIEDHKQRIATATGSKIEPEVEPEYILEFDEMIESCSSSGQFHDLEIYFMDNKALQTKGYGDKVDGLGKLYGDDSYRK